MREAVIVRQLPHAARQIVPRLVHLTRPTTSRHCIRTSSASCRLDSKEVEDVISAAASPTAHRAQHRARRAVARASR